MKVIAFNGSPRKKGNTSILIDTVFEELEQQDIKTECVHVGAKQVQGCIACMKCWENKDGHCILKNDNVNECLDKMVEANGIILGSPVYCAGLSGQIKSFMDRTSMVACANNLFNRKPGASIVAVRRAGSVATFHMLNAFFTITQMIIVGSSYWNQGFGMSEGEVKKDTEGLQTMRNLGQNMAWLIKSIEAAKVSIPEPVTNRDVLMSFIRETN
ncbi:MAG: FMN reductase [Gammaproteobacteria bacterium GWF2_41_13]|nr:MAG: FMN reductase [Gammaproteobacteria bacterium GWF2_41_13]